jgi:hypothetical protein
MLDQNVEELLALSGSRSVLSYHPVQCWLNCRDRSSWLLSGSLLTHGKRRLIMCSAAHAGKR